MSAAGQPVFPENGQILRRLSSDEHRGLVRIKAYVPGEVQGPASPGIAGCDLVQDERVHEVQIPVGRHGSARNAVGPVEGESRLAVGYACAQGFQLPDAVLGAKDDILQAGLQTGLSEARVIAADSGLNGQPEFHGSFKL